MDDSACFYYFHLSVNSLPPLDISAQDSLALIESWTIILMRLTTSFLVVT